MEGYDMASAGLIARAPLLVLTAALLLSACGGSDGGAETDASEERGDAPTAMAASSTYTTSQPAPATVEAAVTTARDTAAETAQGEPASIDQTEEPQATANLAPALGSIDEWHNSAPLSLDALRGAPVLLVFWADF
jgi:hypothetical protein